MHVAPAIKDAMDENTLVVNAVYDAIVFWFSVNWRIQSFELAYKNGGIHHAQTT